jgi:hypothetical protein
MSIPTFQQMQYWAGLVSSLAEDYRTRATVVGKLDDGVHGSAQPRLKAAAHHDAIADQLEGLATFVDWIAARHNRLDSLGEPWVPEWKQRQAREQLAAAQRAQQPTRD